MQLFHTSPAEITSINGLGLFGSFLCFSENVYVMTAGEHVAYRLEIDEDDIIEAGQLFYHDDAEKLDGLVARVMDMLDCDEGEAIEQIEQRADFCGDADDSWEIQHISAQAARLLGYRGVSMQDEQGTVYMIDMMGRENELERA
ncbi:hypothetical protein H0A73_17565 [Alcaligenaceae bacterium]|nr:hypothetical protein [Alcaligenaceae bacterium]